MQSREAPATTASAPDPRPILRRARAAWIAAAIRGDGRAMRAARLRVETLTRGRGRRLRSTS